MKNVVVTELLGGLGNQMFQYAIGRAVAKNAQLYLCTKHFESYSLRKYELGNYKIHENFASENLIEQFGLQYKFRKKTVLEKIANKIRPIKPAKGFTEVREKKDFIYDPTVFNYEDNLYLTGFWQSPKYFESIQNDIRNEFQLKTEPTGMNREYIDLFSKKNAVSVHIRRGDYVSNPSAASFHGSCSIDYYQHAYKKIISELKSDLFVVFSDDIAWCRENIQFPAETLYMEHNSPEQGFEDIRLMQNCSAHIIANSTFSWWGAWLAGEKSQMVIAPSQWTSKFANVPIDIYPESWIKI